MAKLDHGGFISYQPVSEPLVEYYTTTTDDEIIMFTDIGGEQRQLNAVLIENTNDFDIRIIPVGSNHVLYIPAGESRTLDYMRLTGIQILGNSGLTLRWSGQFY